MSQSTHISNGRLAARASQGGATLIVGLVLLLVLTVLGVSGMNMATMEITMAGNTQFQQNSFQLAEDAIDVAIAQEIYRLDELPETVDRLNVQDFDRAATILMMRPDTDIPDEANSTGIPGATRAFHFEIAATGSGPRGGTASHRQSFYIRGRAP